MNKKLLVLHVLECGPEEEGGAGAGEGAGDVAMRDAGASAAAAAAPAATASSALEGLRVVEAAVARWNPNKGRAEPSVRGV